MDYTTLTLPPVPIGQEDETALGPVTSLYEAFASHLYPRISPPACCLTNATSVRILKSGILTNNPLNSDAGPDSWVRFSLARRIHAENCR